MEGDFASGSVVLAEYLRVNEVLQQLRDASNFPSIMQMIDTMLVKLLVYQDEAASSDVIILATVMNPKYRLRFFDLHYPEYAETARELIESAFQDRLKDWPVTPPSTPPPGSRSNTPFDQFDVFTSAATFQSSDSIRSSELEIYLQGTVPITPGQSELSWWLVSFHHYSPLKIHIH
jgi:hypothetical protein